MRDDDGLNPGKPKILEDANSEQVQNYTTGMYFGL